MNQITFSYNQIETKIQYNQNENMKDIISKYVQKSRLDRNKITFLYSGYNIDTNNEDIAIKGENQIILVIDNLSKEDDVIVNSNNIICPKCKTCARISIEDNKIRIYDCDNKHNIEGILIDKFNDTQKINISQIKCDACSNDKNKGNSYKNEFYKCFTCNMNLCLLCKTNHNQSHMINNYDLKNFICRKHNDKYIKFCKKCNLNICMFCQSEHKQHSIVDFGDIIQNNNKLEQIKININKINNFIENQIRIYINVKKNLEQIYLICEKMNNYYIKYNDNIYYNYQTLNNLNEINNIKVPDTINNDIILDLYNQMNDSILIKYKGSIEPINIFGADFVENNEKCEIIYKGKKSKITEIFKSTDNIIEIQLTGIRNITNSSHMFFDCPQLLEVPDISRWDTRKIVDMSGMFCSCILLKSLPDISYWDTRNVSDMSDLFHGCSSLTSLPDISKWDLIKTKDIGGMFYGCSSLSILPDISKWNTINLEDMSDLFHDCSSLSTLPDLSKWNLKNVKNKMNLSKNCPASLNIPSKFK